MRWKKMTDKEEIFPKTTCSGTCKLYGQQAEVTSFFCGTVECRTDLQRTYRFKGYKCSLQEKNDFHNPVCMEECFLIQKEYL